MSPDEQELKRTDNFIVKKDEKDNKRILFFKQPHSPRIDLDNLPKKEVRYE